MKRKTSLNLCCRLTYFIFIYHMKNHIHTICIIVFGREHNLLIKGDYIIIKDWLFRYKLFVD